jgi:hypothetical protein
MKRGFQTVVAGDLVWYNRSCREPHRPEQVESSRGSYGLPRMVFLRLSHRHGVYALKKDI